MTQFINKFGLAKNPTFFLPTLILVILAMPFTSQAAMATYTPQTTLEFISYLQGLVDGLQSQVQSGSNSSAQDQNSSSSSSNSASLTTDHTSYDTSDTIRVRYHVPSDEVSYSNWIGMYEEGAANRNYVMWRRLSSSSGTVEFKTRQEGEYEFRLFYTNEYDDEETSRTIRVRD